MVFLSSDFALHVHGDLGGRSPRATAVYLGNIADLRGKIACHGVHAVCQILPGARYGPHVSLAAQPPAVRPRAPRAHLAGKCVELIDHGVDGLLQLKDLTAHVHGNLLRQIAPGNGRRHLGDIPHLAVRFDP